MDEYVILRNYQNTLMMRFVINIVLYAFSSVRKKDDYCDMCS